MIFDRELDYYALLGRETEPALTSNSLIMQLRWCLRGARHLHAARLRRPRASRARACSCPTTCG